MDDAAPPVGPVSEPAAAPDLQPGSGLIGEDWLATIVGLVLVVLALLGVIGKGVIP